MVEVSQLSITELESLIERYPWFSLARRELFLKMSSLGEEYMLAAIKKSAAYMFSRAELLKEVENIGISSTMITYPAIPQEISVPIFEANLDEIMEAGTKEDVKELSPEVDKNRIYVVGGDYFSKEEMEQIREDGALLSFSINKENIDKNIVVSVPAENDTPDLDELCTETLAKVYIEQGHFQRALDIYDKLILLYPEKSTYFATLINEIKNK